MPLVYVHFIEVIIGTHGGRKLCIICRYTNWCNLQHSEIFPASIRAYPGPKFRPWLSEHSAIGGVGLPLYLIIDHVVRVETTCCGYEIGREKHYWINCIMYYHFIQPTNAFIQHIMWRRNLIKISSPCVFLKLSINRRYYYKIRVMCSPSWNLGNLKNNYK